MKVLRVNPLAAKKREAEQRINDAFNRIARAQLHRDAAHRLKREDARRVVSGQFALGSEISFAAEAARAGRRLEDFAQMILSKADDVALREDLRRQLIETVRAASTEAEIAGAISQLMQTS